MSQDVYMNVVRICFFLFGQWLDDFEYTVGENKKNIRMYMIVKKDGCVYDCQNVYRNVVRICFFLFGQWLDDFEYTVGETKNYNIMYGIILISIVEWIVRICF